MPHLVLIDGSGFIHRAFHVANPNMVRSSDDLPIGAIQKFAEMLWGLLRKFHTVTHAAVIGDAGGETFRHKKYPAYKGNRGPRAPELTAQIAMIPEAVQAFDLPYVEVAGVEADDIIATYATFWAGMQDFTVTVVSSDKDLIQLIAPPAIKLFDPYPTRNKIVTPADVVERFGVEPHQLGDWLALVGDTSDNIPGVPSIGAKTAAKLLQEHGSIGGIFDNEEKLPPNVQKVMTAHQVSLTRSRFLVKLKCDVPDLPNPHGFLHRGWQVPKLPAYLRSIDLLGLAEAVESDWRR